tara:strand:- start:141 stop:1388 length:1248 start_codon:yes stop_codon:yes gene_type:complete
MSKEYFGGLDFGSSGARLSIINFSKELLYEQSCSYKADFKNPEGWINSCIELFKGVPIEIKLYLTRLAISGTSGTLVPCELNGHNLGNAIPYNESCSSNPEKLNLIAGKDNFLNNPYSSLAKAIKLIDIFGENILLRHQSDWISGWFLNNWEYGEEGNNIKLGWNIIKSSWPSTFESFSIKKCIPTIIKSGSILGKINNLIADKLQTSRNLLIISGTTDSNAAFLAAQVKEDEGLTILGTTIVLKKLTKNTFSYPGITIHRVKEDLICGGSSNAGCGILSKFFSDLEIEELSRQINPRKNTNLNYLPLNTVGERFPVDDPFLEPILNPRPVSDSLYLHGLLEGLTRIELKGWERLKEITGSFPNKIITLGGGSKNPQWKAIRERILKIPILNSNKTTSFGSALIALSSNDGTLHH